MTITLEVLTPFEVVKESGGGYRLRVGLPRPLGPPPWWEFPSRIPPGLDPDPPRDGPSGLLVLTVILGVSDLLLSLFPPPHSDHRSSPFSVGPLPCLHPWSDATRVHGPGGVVTAGGAETKSGERNWGATNNTDGVNLENKNTG